jgi:Ferric reductase like transmembrane component
MHRQTRIVLKVTGDACVVISMVTYIAAAHNNTPVLLALGLPFDRALPWHKLLGVALIFNSFVHLVQFYAGGRADVYSPEDRDKPHHIFKHLKVPYGMEISGVPCAFHAPSFHWSHCVCRMAQ